MMQRAKINRGIDQDDKRIFPLSPEAVRRLRQRTDSEAASGQPSCRDDPTTTHADDLLRHLLQC